MAEKIRLVQGDTLPQIRLTLTDDLTGNPKDLTGSTVTLHFRAVGADTNLFSRQGTLGSDADQGVCVIAWEEGDLDQEPGDYEGEIEIVFPTGGKETVYEFLKFKIREDIA